MLHRTPIRFIRAFTGAAKVSGPLLLQYPLYGGLVGLPGYLPSHAADETKPLQTLLARAFVSGATQYTLPFLTFTGSLAHQRVRAVRRGTGRAGPDRGRAG